MRLSIKMFIWNGAEKITPWSSFHPFLLQGNKCSKWQMHWSFLLLARIAIARSEKVSNRLVPFTRVSLMNDHQRADRKGLQFLVEQWERVILTPFKRIANPGMATCPDHLRQTTRYVLVAAMTSCPHKSAYKSKVRLALKDHYSNPYHKIGTRQLVSSAASPPTIW